MLPLKLSFESTTVARYLKLGITSTDRSVLTKMNGSFHFYCQTGVLSLKKEREREREREREAVWSTRVSYMVNLILILFKTMNLEGILMKVFFETVLVLKMCKPRLYTSSANFKGIVVPTTV